MSTEEKLSESLTVRVTPQMKNELKKRAKKQNRKMSNFVLDLLEHALIEEEAAAYSNKSATRSTQKPEVPARGGPKVHGGSQERDERKGKTQ